MNTLTRQLRLGAVTLLSGIGLAQAHVSVDVGVHFGPPHGAVAYGHGAGRHWSHGGIWYAPWASPFLVVAPPVEYLVPVEPVPAPPPESVAPSRPDPVIVPRNGQSAQQTEYDRQECNRWATTQRAAMADAGIFQRAVEACMDGRGYTTK